MKTFFIGVGLFLTCVFTYALRETYVQAACLDAGYPSFRVNWELTGYCVRRVDQTDIVVPLAALRVRGIK